jgi:hypothetical protein
MDITFKCDACGQDILIDEAGAGLTVQCPNCGQSLIVPKATTAKSILAVAPTPIDPAFLYTLFRGRGPSKVTQIIGAQYFYRTREQTVDGPFNKLEMRGLTRKKIVEPETVVLCPATQTWLPCERFPELPKPAYNKLLHFQKDERFAALVKEITQKIVDHIGGKISESDVGSWLVKRIQECGYQCPDFDEGTINDLVSEERIKIIVEKNRQTWCGYLTSCHQLGRLLENPPELIGF